MQRNSASPEGLRKEAMSRAAVVERLIDLAAELNQFSPEEILALASDVAENGTDHEDGSVIDYMVHDMLETAAERIEEARTVIVEDADTEVVGEAG
jgi:hypothetical protein